MKDSELNTLKWNLKLANVVLFGFYLLFVGSFFYINSVFSLIPTPQIFLVIACGLIIGIIASTGRLIGPCVPVFMFSFVYYLLGETNLSLYIGCAAVLGLILGIVGYMYSTIESRIELSIDRIKNGDDK